MSATAGLTPVTAFDSPHLDFDFPGLKIGCAEYEEGPTGCTVFVFAGGVVTARCSRRRRLWEAITS